MKRVDEVLDECIFDRTIEHDMATVSINVAEEAMRRYAKIYHQEQVTLGTVCKHCGETKDKHSTASELCTTKFKHFEAN